jgi:hypothetical protein
MYARAMVAKSAEGRYDDLVGFWPGERLEEIRRQPGSAGFFVVANPATHDVLAVSLWDDKGSAEASQSVFKSHVGVFGSMLAGPPSVIAG